MKLEVDIDEEIVTGLARKFDYQSTIINENGEGIENPISKEGFIKLILVEQVVNLLIEDIVKQEISNYEGSIKPTIAQTIREKIIVREGRE